MTFIKQQWGENVEIIIKGKPIAKKRPRFARCGKFTKVYNPQSTEEGRWLWEAKQQITECIEEPIAIDINFCFERPKSHFGTGKNLKKLKPSAPRLHTQKPDIDNCIKFVLDCLNGHAFKDDKQIFSISANKFWDEEEGTFIKII